MHPRDKQGRFRRGWMSPKEMESGITLAGVVQKGRRPEKPWEIWIGLKHRDVPEDSPLINPFFKEKWAYGQCEAVKNQHLQKLIDGMDDAEWEPHQVRLEQQGKNLDKYDGELREAYLAKLDALIPIYRRYKKLVFFCGCQYAGRERGSEGHRFYMCHGILIRRYLIAKMQEEDIKLRTPEDIKVADARTKKRVGAAETLKEAGRPKVGNRIVLDCTKCHRSCMGGAHGRIWVVRGVGDTRMTIHRADGSGHNYMCPQTAAKPEGTKV